MVLMFQTEYDNINITASRNHEKASKKHIFLNFLLVLKVVETYILIIRRDYCSQGIPV